MTRSRIGSLDGLRGLAILLVIGFHAFARWPEHIPWATLSGDFPLLKLGRLGVQLFFMISGFVIMMTLEANRDFGHFIFRRWLRLFPGMLAATLLILGTSAWLVERPGGPPSLLETVPGLLFLDPIWIREAFATSILPIEGAFWSLFVEVKFYAAFGMLVMLTRRYALPIFCGVYMIFFVYQASLYIDHAFLLPKVERLLDLTSLRHFGWFCVGALVYCSYRTGDKRPLVLSAVFMPATVIGGLGFNSHAPADTIFAMLLYVVFVAAILTDIGARIASSRALLFMGFISYPIYLIHENAMIAMTIKVHDAFPGFPGLLTPLPGIAALVGVAYLIARYVEPYSREGLKSALRAVCSG